MHTGSTAWSIFLIILGLYKYANPRSTSCPQALSNSIPFCVDLNGTGTGQANSQERSQERVGTAAAEYEFSYEFSALSLARKKV